ncbi:hypothetical protein MJO29_012193 [Puccinia striiformis f. sp. tritici]|nr:hypothetical protein MJO29_012193 [Puccinia striiformis f. sp. tritici]
MALDDQINRKIATAIGQISAKFDMKFKDQNKQINKQPNEIINLSQANTSFLNAQSQWNRVVDELEHIKVVLNEVLSLLRKPDYAASAGISTGVVVFPIDNKPKNEEKLLPPKDIDSCQSSYRTPSQSTSQGQLRLMDVLEAGRGKFLLDLGASTHGQSGSQRQQAQSKSTTYVIVLASMV